VAAALVSAPVLVVAASLMSDSGGVWSHLADTVLPGYIGNTLVLALGVGSISSAVGVACGWLIAMCRFPGHRFFSWALLLPLAIPTYLIAYAYTDLLQFSGPVQSWLRATLSWSRQDYWFPEARSLSGAVLMLSAVLYPYVYLAARTAFLEQSACALEVGRTLGMSPWGSFRRVALPLARPSIAAGASLVLMETVAEFGAVDYCAVDTMATGIYRTLTGLGSRTAAAQLSAVLLLMVAVALAIERLCRGRARHYHATYRSRALPAWRLRGWRAALAVLACAFPILVGFAGPTLLFARMTWLGGDERARQLAWDLGQNTFLVAAISSFFAVVLSLLIAYGKRLRPTRPMKLSAAIAGLGYAIPGGVVAIGVLIPTVWIDHRLGDALDAMFAASSGLLLSGTIIAVLFGYQVRFLAVSLSVVEGGLGRIRGSLDDAARILGASRGRTLLRVHVPLLRGSLLAAALLVFVDVTKELPATLILRPFGFDTLAVRVHRLASDERLHEASTGALMIILVGLIPVFLLSRAIAHSRPGGDEIVRDIRI
jgi:iron(III) transport system permease protein